MKQKNYFCLSIIIFLGLTACAEEESLGDPYFGDMKNTSYGGQVTSSRIKSRVNGHGEYVVINQYAGRFVWSDYAAFWCSPCIPQSRVIQRLHESKLDKVSFLTIITSVVANANQTPPGEQDAKEWAERFKLNPDHVVAATDQWTRTVPSHVLYSPEGHTLYSHTGSLTEDQILQVMDKYIYDWEEWKAYGTRAAWMH